MYQAFTESVTNVLSPALRFPAAARNTPDKFIRSGYNQHHGLYSGRVRLNALLTVTKLWTLFNKLPTSTSKGVQDQTRLSREVVRLKREMNSTSSQDEFAKWAKLRRQHDKVLAEYEQKSETPGRIWS